MKGAPFTKKKDGKVRDRGGEVIDLFPGVREALLEVYRGHRFRNTKLAIASRTSHDRWVDFFCVDVLRCENGPNYRHTDVEYKNWRGESLQE